MAEVIGLGFSAQDRWSRKNNNTFQLQDSNVVNPFTKEPVYMMADEWVVAGNIAQEHRTLSDFYAMREAKLNANVQNIFTDNIRKGGFPIDVFAKTLNDSSEASMRQVYSAIPSWDAFIDMIDSGNGSMYGIDIETFGNISDAKGIFGITEIGINQVIMKNGERRMNPMSIAIGINNEQTAYLESLVDRFEHSGWNSLDDIEQNSLLRMSKYATEKNIAERFATGMSNNSPLDNKSYTIVKNLLPESIDAGKMRSGIKNLNYIYNNFSNTQAETVMKSVMGFIDSHSDSLFYAANSKFDFGGLKNVAMANGVAVASSIDDVAAKALDIVYLIRAAAAVDGQSVSAWGQTVYGRSGGASVESLLRMLRISGSQEHHGGSDLVNELNILAREEGTIYKTYRDAIINMMEHRSVIDPEHTLYYMRRGQFNKMDADDFAYVPSSVSAGGYRASANYAITEEFWKIDTSLSGDIEVDGKNKFRLVLTNAADELNGVDATKIVLTGDTAEDVAGRLSYMSEAFDEGVIKDKLIKFQQEYHYNDLGRREFDRMFSPSDVRTERKLNFDGNYDITDVGGYASLKKYLDIEKIVSAWEEKNGLITGTNSTAARKIYEIVQNERNDSALKSVLDDMASGKITTRDSESLARILKGRRNSFAPFESEYDAQVFVGMRPMLKDKMPLLQSIVDKIDKDDAARNGNEKLNNIDKTLVAKKAFEDSMGIITTEHTPTSSKKNSHIRNITDEIDIDILVGNDEYRRINGYSQKNITDGLSKLFLDMTPEQIKESVNDLYERKLIDYQTGSRVIDAVYNADVTTKKSYSNAMYFAAQDIAYGMDTDKLYLYNTASASVFAEPGTQRIMKSTTKNMMNDYINMRFEKIRGKKHGYGFADAFEMSRKNIETTIDSVISNAPNTVYNSNKFLTDDQIKMLMDNLNLSSGTEEQVKDKKELIKQMFDGTKSNKKYAINERSTLQAFIVNNDGNSSYMFITRNQDAQRLYEKLMSDVYDYSSYGSLRASIEENGGNLGTVIELPHLNEYNLGYGRKAITVNQGPESEKFLLPGMNVSMGDDGKMYAYFNDSAYDILTLWRRYGENALNETELGNYGAASKMGRRVFNKFIENMPSSSSYRREIDGRVMHFGPSDSIHADEIRVMTDNGLKAIFNHMVLSQEVPDNAELLNVAQRIVYEFGKNEDVNSWMINSRKKTMRDFLTSVMNSDVFDQFFMTRMVIGDLSEVSAMQNSDATRILKDPILEVMRNEIMQNYEKYGFDKSVKTAMSHIVNASGLNPVGTETAVGKGSLFTRMVGEWTPHAGIVSTMRPTYTQWSNGIFFDPKKAAQEVADGLFGGLDKDVISYGRHSLERIDFEDRKALLKNGIDVGEKNFMIKVKYMSEMEMQQKLGDLTNKTKSKSFRKSLMKEFGITEEQYFKIAEVFQSDMFSMYEDNSLIAPGLKETDLFQSRELMKYSIDVSNLSEKDTLAALKKVIGKKIDSGTVISVKKNGQPIFYTGAEAIFSKTNYDTIVGAFDDAVSDDVSIANFFLQPTKGGALVDDKMMFNASEKTTVHSINMDAIRQIMGIFGNSMKPIAIANRIFGLLSDGAGVIMNPKSAKHGAVHSSISDWNVIMNYYAANNKTNMLAGYLNNLVKNDKVLGAGIGRFESVNNRLIGETALGEHNAMLIERMVSDIRANTGLGLDKDTNEMIVNQLDEMKRLNQQMDIAQRQHMTEFVGKKYTMDQRTDQAMRMRGMRLSIEGGDGILETSARIADDLREYSKNYTGTSDTLSKYGFSNLQKIANAVSIAQNTDKIKYATAHNDMERTVKGISEVVRAYNNEPITSKNLAEKNIVELNINDMINSMYWNEGGISTDDLKSSLFFIDGRPSKLLQQQAARQGVDLKKDSYSIFINMGMDINVGNGKTTDGILVPIQSVNALAASDEHYLQNGQAYTTKMFNDIIDYIRNPQSRKKDVTIDTIYKDYVGKILTQLDYMDKDADFTKAIQQYAVPTSQYLLGQDEASPLLKSQMGKAFTKIVDGMYDAERKIIESPYDNALMAEYRAALGKYNSEIDSTVKAIMNGENKFSQYNVLTTKGNKHLGDAMKVFDKDRKLHHGMGMAMSEEAFKAKGYVMSDIAMDLIADMEKVDANPNYKGQYDKIVKFNQDHGSQIAELKRKLDGLYINEDITLKIDPNKRLMSQLDEQLGISIKDINKSIASGNKKIGVARVVDLFETSRIAQDYLSEVGTYEHILRSPIFMSQPIAKVMLDQSMRGMQMRSLDAAMSLIIRLDFDGDTVAAIARLTGYGLMKNTDQIWNDYDFEWRRFAIEDHNNFLAKLIKDGEPFRKEQATAHRMQQAFLLKIDNEDAYNQALQKFLDNHNILDANGKRITSIHDKGMDDAVKYAANNSYEMSSMFEQEVGNTLKNEKMTIAAYAARKRKEYIGKVSTPAFRIRSSIIDAMDSGNVTEGQRKFLNDILVNFDNMLSERGGFMQVSEQRGIDTKFAKDAIKYSKLAKWASAMTKIVKGGEDAANVKNVVDIMEAIGSNVYDISSDNEYKMYAEAVLNTDTKRWSELYKKSLTDESKDMKIVTRFGDISGLGTEQIQELWGLSDFIRAARDIPELSKVFKERYDKMSYAGFFTGVEGTQDLASLINQVRNTPAKDPVNVAKDTTSKVRTIYEKDMVYFHSGAIFEDFDKTEYFVHNGGNQFSKIVEDPKTKLPVAIGKPEYHSNYYFAGQKGYDFSDYRNDLNGVRDSLQDDVITERIYNTINRFTITRDRATQQSKIAIRKGSSEYWQMYRDRYDPKVATNVVPYDAQMGRDTIEWIHGMFDSFDADEVNNYVAAYNKAKAVIGSDAYKYDSGAELIRAINHKIAEDGWKDLSGLKKPASDYYDVLLRPHVMEVFGSEDNYKRFLDLAVNMPNFSNEKYAQAIDSLNGRLYDISSLEDAIGKQYERVVEERQFRFNDGRTYEELEALNNFLKTPKKNYVNSKVNALHQKNVNIISEAQSNIYNMFENNDQIVRHFGLDGVPEQRDQIVGFGEFMGRRFSELSGSDIKKIMDSSFDEYSFGLTTSNRAKLRAAMEGTKRALTGYEPTSVNDSAIVRISDAASKEIIDNTRDEIKKIFDTIFDQYGNPLQPTTSQASASASAAAAVAGKTVEYKSLSGSAFTSMKNIFGELGIGKKTVGITVGAMAALGILNNIVHRERPQSPLAPARTSKHNNAPYTKDQEPQQPIDAAPQTRTRTVYHDDGSGLNFKVSGSTKNIIDAKNNARLVSMAGGGEPSIHTYADMNGVSNNWLENKFAQLAT